MDLSVSLSEKQQRTITTLLKRELLDHYDQHYRYGHERMDSIEQLESTLRAFEPSFDRTAFLNAFNRPFIVG